MIGVARTASGVEKHARSFFREPTNVVLLVALPVISIEVYGTALSLFPDLPFLSGELPLESFGRLTGAIFATAAVAGVMGVFQIISAREADQRLAVCGYSAVELLASRFATLVAISGLIAAFSVVALDALVAVEAPALLFAAFLLTGVLYGLVGLLIGSIVPRELEGSLVLVFLADMDNVLASGVFDIDSALVDLAPLTHPHELSKAAVVDGTLAGDHLLATLLYVAVLFVLTIGLYRRIVENGGDPT